MNSDTICGLSAVTALFARRKGEVLRLFYTEAMRQEAGPWCQFMAKQRLPYRMVPPDELARVAGTAHHGGIVAVAKPRVPEILRADALPEAIRPRRPSDLLILLDGIGNPHNLGAIARSAAFFGALGLVFHETPQSALPSDAAYRTAEGGMEQLLLWRTRDLPRIIEALSPHWRCVATTLDAQSQTLDALPRDRPVALVLGNEERGVSEMVMRACRRHVRIVGGGGLQSLNVAQSAAVFLYELTRHRPA